MRRPGKPIVFDTPDSVMEASGKASPALGNLQTPDKIRAMTSGQSKIEPLMYGLSNAA